jgi:hypothetical protein
MWKFERVQIETCMWKFERVQIETCMWKFAWGYTWHSDMQLQSGVLTAKYECLYVCIYVYMCVSVCIYIHMCVYINH